VTKSPVMRTMDKWTFSFVIAFCTIYTEQGKVTELEAAVAALNEMVGVLVAMQSSRDPEVRAFVESLRNTVPPPA
jgi:hypothetical protein